MGTLTLHIPQKKGYMSVYLKNDQGFDAGDEILYQFTDEKIIITRPDIDTVAKATKVTMGFCPTFRLQEIFWEEASYMIDEEESNEDMIVVYREDIILTEEEENE